VIFENLFKALEFQPFNIEGGSVGLPSHSMVHFQMVRGQATNEADYGSYRLASFSANTEITFGDEVPQEKQ
jgi:hypothetical protein